MLSEQVARQNGTAAEKVVKVSVVVPVYNEVESLPHLIEAIATALTAKELSYEIICVDDGSKDGSDEFLKQQAQTRTDLKAVLLRRNYGQTAAMAAGFNYSQGKAIVTLDGDLQNDPADIPLLLAKLEEGYDLVSGWRQKRQDAALTRLLPSKIANWLIGRITDVKLHDYGCSLKAYRSELVADMNLYGELHRFLPALAFIEGARIAELPVRHHARRYGQSKYGLWRTFRVLMDLLTISFMKTFFDTPDARIWAVWSNFNCFRNLIGTLLNFLKTRFRSEYWQSPFADFCSSPVGNWSAMLFSFGLLAELLMRTYHESQGPPSIVCERSSEKILSKVTNSKYINN